MAEQESIFGKIRGRIGNVDYYTGANGKNYCKAACFKRKPGDEPEKRRAAVFGTVAGMKSSLLKVIRVGFPGGKGYPKGVNGFTSANAVGVVEPEAIAPNKPFNNRKKATEQFRGIIRHEKLRVAAGTLVTPKAEAHVDPENRKVTFIHHGILINSVDCFLDDKIYGVILSLPKRFCRLIELGTRGETTDLEIDLPETITPDDTALYVFATSASGKEASDSACLWVPLSEKDSSPDGNDIK